MEQLLSDNLIELGTALPKAIEHDANDKKKKDAETGVAYYNLQHDILKNRIIYVDDNGTLKEDKFATNTKIPHGFFRELVDQAKDYGFSNMELETELDATDGGVFKSELEKYFNRRFMVTLKKAVAGASQKGHEYIFARMTAADRLEFEVADSLHVFPVYDKDNQVKRIIRHYGKDIYKEGKKVRVMFAEVWTDKEVIFYVREGDEPFRLDPAREINPRPHIVAMNEVGQKAGTSYADLLGYSYGVLPFYRLANNDDETTDLTPVKELIDDYDMMNAYLTNNLQDFTEAVFVVSGFAGSDLSELRYNVKNKKIVGTGMGGSVDVKTFDIPVEGRIRKMELDKENIYQFGQGFDANQVGDGNITNIVLKSRYSRLNMKVDNKETFVQAFLEWAAELVVADINRRTGKGYSAEMVEFTFSREAIANDVDAAQIDFTNAQAQQVRIQSVLAASPQLDEQTALELLAELLDVDPEEVQKRLDENGAELDLFDDLEGDEEIGPSEGVDPGSPQD